MSILINGLKTRFIRGGNKEAKKTIVLVHGSNMCADMLFEYLEHLSEFNVVLPDMIGHGGSEGITPSTVKEQAEFLETFLIRLHKNDEITNDTFLAGYSLGGALVAEVGARNLPFITGIGIFNSCDFQKHSLKGTIPEDIKKFDIGKAFAGIMGAKSDKVKLSKIMKHPQKLRTAHADLYAASRYHFRNLSNLTVPILLIGADNDNIAPAEGVVELFLNAPDARICIIPYRGHTSFLEVPEEYCRAIKDLFYYGTRNK